MTEADWASGAARTSPLHLQRAWLDRYQLAPRLSERGILSSVGDGIAWIEGLPSAAIDDVIVFEEGSRAVVFSLTRALVGAVLTHQTEALTAGMICRLTGRRLSVPVGHQLLGRVVDPMGVPLDGCGPIETTRRGALDVLSPKITSRDFVHEPLYTGIKIVDTLIPIGRGQRQLVIGDTGIGRSSIALSAVVNQSDKDVLCVYVMIGQKRSDVVNTLALLRELGAMAFTTIVVGEASALPGLKYLAPFAGCAIAEGWMADGRHTLVVYDNLTTHAQNYRELSLLLNRPPGREAYPGDIFYLHARLLERATCLAVEEGGGSMTALPIVDTKEGEIASYIPTNLISITDGQIYLDADLFSAGQRPAIDVAKSVSRIGGKAQHPRIKAESGRMKLDYLQYLELEVFTRFGARLEAEMESKIRRGRILREILKQDRLAPVSTNYQLAWLTAFNRGLFDDVESDKVAIVLDMLAQRLKGSELTLESGRKDWSAAVTAWVAEARSQIT